MDVVVHERADTRAQDGAKGRGYETRGSRDKQAPHLRRPVGKAGSRTPLQSSCRGSLPTWDRRQPSMPGLPCSGRCPSAPSCSILLHSVTAFMCVRAHLRVRAVPHLLLGTRDEATYRQRRAGQYRQLNPVGCTSVPQDCYKRTWAQREMSWLRPPDTRQVRKAGAQELTLPQKRGASFSETCPSEER